MTQARCLRYFEKSLSLQPLGLAVSTWTEPRATKDIENLRNIKGLDKEYIEAWQKKLSQNLN